MSSHKYGPKFNLVVDLLSGDRELAEIMFQTITAGALSDNYVAHLSPNCFVLSSLSLILTVRSLPYSKLEGGEIVNILTEYLVELLGKDKGETNSIVLWSASPDNQGDQDKIKEYRLSSLEQRAQRCHPVTTITTYQKVVEPEMPKVYLEPIHPKPPIIRPDLIQFPLSPLDMN